MPGFEFLLFVTVDLSNSLHLTQPHYPQPHMEMEAVLTCGVLRVIWDTTHSAWCIVRVYQHVAVADWLPLSSNMREWRHPAWASPPGLPVAANLTLHFTHHTLPLVSHVHVGLMGVGAYLRILLSLRYMHPLSDQRSGRSGEKERATMSLWLGSFCLGPADRKLVL